ncbi:MAG: hypothetical protein ACP5P1_06845 [Acidimicrobiales bacterium]
MAAKLVVTASKGGSRISLVGTSGTELLGSKIFDEPRAKGATLRSLKSLLGEDIVVEDYTLSDGRASRLAKSAAGASDVPEPAVETLAESPKPRAASKATPVAKSARKGPVKSTAKPAAKAPSSAPSKTAPKAASKAVARTRKQPAK